MVALGKRISKTVYILYVLTVSRFLIQSILNVITIIINIITI